MKMQANGQGTFLGLVKWSNQGWAYRTLKEKRGGHYIGDCTPTRDQDQNEIKWSRWNFEAGQAVKVGIRGSLETVEGSPGDRWAWLLLNSQGSRPDFWCGQGVKHKNLMGQDLDRDRR